LYLPTGYKYGYTDPATLPATIADGGVIKVIYERDYDQCKTISYVVEYYKDGDKIDADTLTVSRSVWVNDPDTLTVNIADTRDVNKYYGYELEKTEPVEIPVTIADGGVIKIYYVRSLFDVTFLPGMYGDFEPFTQQVYLGDKPVPEQTLYAKFGYKFIGWQDTKTKVIYYAADYTKPLDVDLPEVSGEVTYEALWAVVNPDLVFPDKIPSEQHFDRWWADYGIICFAASTTKDDMYTVMFADWFFDVYKTCTIGFGAPGKMDYEIRFTEDGVTLWQKTGNSWKQITNKGDINYMEMTCIRDGHYYAKGLHNYGEDFGMAGTLQGVAFVNPFGSGAKLAWLY
jgi:hypothetical protein